MTKNERTCWIALRSYARCTGERVLDRWDPDQWDGALHLHRESNVCRLRSGVGRSGGHDIGPGFRRWADLETFLRGMLEAEWRLQERDTA